MNEKLVLLILISSLLVVSARANSYADVTVSEAKTMIDSDHSLVVLDVRTQSEYDDGHIRNAKLIPHTELEGRLNELNKTDKILVYCRTGVRSSNASQILVDNGFMYVYNMLGGITAWIDEEYPVYVKYSLIQEAINNANEGDAIYVSSGTYSENVVVNKSLTLIGENRSNTIIDGNKTGIVILATANSITIRDLTVKNGNTGIYVDHSNFSLVIENNIIHNVDAIFVRFSNNCTIYQNLAANNTHRGVLITNSWNFTVRDNYVYGSGWYGINANASINGLIAQNNVYENYYDGIGLLNSSNCAIAGNDVKDNVLFGIWLDSSDDNFIYHNNLINNGIQAKTFPSTNVWDDGVEGNYWSNYTGVDLYGGGDGIGDSPHVIDEYNTDRFPAMGPIRFFNAGAWDEATYYVHTISNSTVSDFYFSEEGKLISFNVTELDETVGFCRVAIPRELLYCENPEDWIVLVNDMPPVHYGIIENGNYTYIHFTYSHSTKTVEIKGTYVIPEFPNALIMSLFMISTLLTVIAYRRKHSV